MEMTTNLGHSLFWGSINKIDPVKNKIDPVKNKIDPVEITKFLQKKTSKLKNILTRLTLPLVAITILVVVFKGIVFISPFKITLTVYSIILILITIIQSVYLKNDYRHVDDKTKIKSHHMIGLAVISSIVFIALICSNVYIPASSIANLIFIILSGIHILLTSLYFIYCYKSIDRNAEYKLIPITFNGRNCTYFGRIDKDNQLTGNGILFDNESQFIYYGEWQNGIMDGHGNLFDNGSIYSGFWKDGNFSEGWFNIETEAGIYTGLYEDSPNNGKGTFTDKNGSYDGMWVDGEFIFTETYPNPPKSPRINILKPLQY